MSTWNQIFLQDANSPIMEMLIMFHDHSMIIIIMIVMMIIYLLLFMIMNKFINRNLIEYQMIEIIWTIIPMIFLMFLAIPSLKILYMTDELNNPMMSIKIIGHQWYWSYEYSDFNNINFDSFMLNDLNSFRLLDVDNRLILPNKIQIRLLINSMDVIHSFAMPTLGIKIDAVPGRLNQVSMMMNRVGLFYGQCSEICGINHSFMPIVIESTNMNNFMKWINLNLKN